MNSASPIARTYAVGRTPGSARGPLAALFVFAALLAPAQNKSQDKQRDLKYEEDKPVNSSVTVPRGYALIVGISKYQKLPASAQLDFPERDADAMYSILINPEAGGFKAENVHRLTGANATLANLKKE